MGIAFLTEITFISVFYSDNKKFRTVVYILIPVCFALLFIFAFIQVDILAIISSMIALLTTSITIYIFNQKRTTLFLYIFTGLVFVGIFMK
jgi:hypothetical protein